MSLKVTPVECKNLKETRSIGKQVPYVKICTGLDTGRVWSTCPQVEFRDMRFADAPFLAVQEWTGPVAQESGTCPKWKANDPTNTAEIAYFPGAEYLRVEVWDKGMMSDSYIARAWVSLSDAFKCTRKPMQFTYSCFRDHGKADKNYGRITLEFEWDPPRPNPTPQALCVPLTLKVKGHADASGKFCNLGFMLYDQTISEALSKASATKDDAKAVACLMATMPSMMKGFAPMGTPFLDIIKSSGGIAISQCDQEALQSGLWPHDVIIGYAQDSVIKDEAKRGPPALVDGTAKWKKIDASSRATALRDLAPFATTGSVTLTVLRALPFQCVPPNHALKIAFVTPPVAAAFEPNSLKVIAGQKLPTVQAGVKPSEGSPYYFKMQDGSHLPDGLELEAQTGRISGVPSVAGDYHLQLVAWNASGQVAFDLKIQVMATPTALVYADGHQKTYAISQPITPNAVSSIDGSGPFVFEAIGLPPGLSLDGSSGEITGTPSVECSGQEVTVTAKGPAGEICATVVVDVQAPPTHLTYTLGAPDVRRGEKMTINVSVDGSNPLSFVSEPELPLGLSFDQAGNICGTPVNSDNTAMTYKIMCNNVAGKAAASINLRIMDSPTDFSYSHGARGAKLVYEIGSEIMENTVSSVTGSRPIMFSSEPALPAGLLLNPESGDITGTPAAVSSPALYMIKARNQVGVAMLPLLIEIIKAQDDVAPAEATDVSGTNEQVQSSEVRSFLEFCGCPQYEEAFIKDGWDDLDSIYTMNQKDLSNVGVAAADIQMVMAKFPGTDKKQSIAKEFAALLKRTECEEYAGLLEQHHMSTIPDLCSLRTEEELVGFGLKRGHARKLFAEILKQKAPGEAVAAGTGGPAAPTAPKLLFPSFKKTDDALQGETCGVGIQLGRFGPSSHWGIGGILPGGPADQEGSIKIGDLLLAIFPGHGPELPITPKTPVEDIVKATKGPRGSLSSLVLKRRGTTFEVNVVRMPVFAQDRLPEARITLRVVSAINLPPMDPNGLCDPYVVLNCNHQVKSTTTCWMTRSAVWNSDHHFMCDRDARLIVSVWDKDRTSADDLIGKFSCRMRDIVDFECRQILQEDIVCPIIASNGMPIVTELGAAVVHLKCVKQAYLTAR